MPPQSTVIAPAPPEAPLQALKRLRALFPTPPLIALVLGSGLGDFADRLQSARRLPTTEIPGYPASTVPGHAGAVVSGKLAGKDLICFQGRVHLYEGYPIEAVVLPVRLAAELGARTLILTNASGGIHRHLQPGRLMLIEDHVDLQCRRRIRQGEPGGMVIEREPWLRRSPFSERLMELAEEAALQEKMPLRRGVLGGWTGPSYETPAEIRLLRTIGVDAACMSTVAEAAEGARQKMEILGISCITNRASGLDGQPLTHEGVIAAAERVKSSFARLLEAVIQRL